MKPENEERIKEIAHGHGWPESEFLAEVNRLLKNYGYFEEGALAQAQKHYAHKFGIAKPEPARKPALSEPKLDPIKQYQKGMDEAQKFKREGGSTPQKTAFDKLLELVGNHLIEIYSDAGNGKSRLAHHIATEAERSGRKVLYLDTEKSLPVGYEKQLKNYEVHTAKTALDLLTQLIARVRRARDEDLNLIVVDSIGLPVLAALPEMDMRERGDAFQLMASLRFQMMGFAFEHGLAIAINQPVSELSRVSIRGKAPKVAEGEPLPPSGGKSEFMAKLILRSEAIQKAPSKSIFKLVVYKAREHGQEYEFARFSIDNKGVSIEWKN